MKEWREKHLESVRREKLMKKEEEKKVEDEEIWRRLGNPRKKIYLFRLTCFHPSRIKIIKILHSTLKRTSLRKFYMDSKKR